MGAYVWPVDNWQATDGSKYTGRRLRQMLGALVTGKTSARPLGARSGVVPGTPSSTVTATATTCTVTAHAGVIDAQTLDVAGAYFYSFDATVTRTVAAASASLDRVDLVVAQITDPAEGNTGTAGVDIVYVTGTAGSGTPATPARSLLLATVAVPKVGTGSPLVSWVAPYTAALGGIIPASGVSQYPASPYVGQYVDDAALGLLRWDGAAWQPYGKGGDTGWQSIPALAGFVSTAQIRRVGKLITLRGVISTSGGGSYPTTYTNAATLPAGFEPPTNVRMAGGTFASGNSNGLLFVVAAGTRTVQVGGIGNSAAGIYLDGMTWLQD